MVNENLRQLDVAYDNKVHGNIIDPYEWNQNFKKIEEVANQNADTLKLIFDSIYSNTIPSPAIEELGQTIESNIFNQLMLIVAALATKSDQSTTDSKINECVKSVSFDTNTGVFTFTTYGGTTTTFDTALEKVPAKMELVEVSGNTVLRITNLDGTYTETDVTSLLNIYTFNTTNTIAYSGSGYNASFDLVKGSVTLEHLAFDAIQIFTEYVNQAQAAAVDAESCKVAAENAAYQAVTSRNEVTNIYLDVEQIKQEIEVNTTLSESWAVGGTESREGENTNNSKYWAKRSQEFAAQSGGITLDIGYIEPEVGPVLWFDTSLYEVSEDTVLFKLTNDDTEVSATIDGSEYGVENATTNTEPTKEGVYDFTVL